MKVVHFGTPWKKGEYLAVKSEQLRTTVFYAYTNARPLWRRLLDYRFPHPRRVVARCSHFASSFRNPDVEAKRKRREEERLRIALNNAKSRQLRVEQNYDIVTHSSFLSEKQVSHLLLEIS